jgi:hypothetical protein
LGEGLHGFGDQLLEGGVAGLGPGEGGVVGGVVVLPGAGWLDETEADHGHHLGAR